MPGLRGTKYAVKSCSKPPPFFQSILEKAKAEDFGTIVIGRRRLTPLKRRTFGRVGSNIFKHADDHVVWIVQ